MQKSDARKDEDPATADSAGRGIGGVDGPVVSGIGSGREDRRTLTVSKWRQQAHPLTGCGFRTEGAPVPRTSRHITRATPPRPSVTPGAYFESPQIMGLSTSPDESTDGSAMS